MLKITGNMAFIVATCRRVVICMKLVMQRMSPQLCWLFLKIFLG